MKTDASFWLPEPIPTSATLTLPPVGSFITKYTEYTTRRTDAPAEAHALKAVGALLALACSGPSLPIATGPRGWRLTLRVQYIVNSTVVLRPTVLNLARETVSGLLGRADAGHRPAEGLPPEPDRVLPVEAPDTGAPEEAAVQPARTTPPEPELPRGSGRGRQAFDLDEYDGAPGTGLVRWLPQAG